jgi:hypothetical protein
MEGPAMTYKILILGASYGSLLGTKLLMAGHDVTLVCRAATANLINDKGTEVRIKLRDEKDHRSFLSADLPGRLDATTPEAADPTQYDLVCLAMQEPQYANPALSVLLAKVAAAKVPCMSIMNMPPLAYLRRIPGLDCKALESAYTKVHVWDGFEPGLMSLCSPDPQAFRPPEEQPNVLHVGLPTNFKAATFEDPRHNAMLAQLEADIAAARVDGKDVPVKLRVHDSLFTPFAKWSMLATGNYRCVTRSGMRAIRDAVHADLEVSRQIYTHVDQIIVKLGGDAADLVPFEKYAEAANSLLKPSSAARAIAAGATEIERVDKLIQLVGRTLGMNNPAIDDVVATVDQALAKNRTLAA